MKHERTPDAPSPGPVTGLEIARCSFVLLILWQPLWYGWLAPVQTLPLLLVLGVMMLPLVVCLPWVWRKVAQGMVLAGCLVLIHFSVAVMELWTSPQTWLPATVQLVLTLVYYAALSIGLRSNRKT